MSDKKERPAEGGNSMTIGFIGNPNCGKTTLFNAYTGANLKVANWPGGDGGKGGGRHQRPRAEDPPGGPARHLLFDLVHDGRDCFAQLYPQRRGRRGHQRGRRLRHRAQLVSDLAAFGAEQARGDGAEHDGHRQKSGAWRSICTACRRCWASPSSPYPQGSAKGWIFCCTPPSTTRGTPAPIRWCTNTPPYRTTGTTTTRNLPWCIRTTSKTRSIRSSPPSQKNIPTFPTSAGTPSSCWKTTRR